MQKPQALKIWTEVNAVVLKYKNLCVNQRLLQHSALHYL